LIDAVCGRAPVDLASAGNDPMKQAGAASM
jgi:hypothetical protein